ncbi:MAG: type VI secretion system baseplate subunit TssF [Neisseriaceae bacterium]|nr:type VI secretion system baseplate subunit TssF [Neisseriaceae bacterium]
MNHHFLNYYNRELAYLREMGQEFAHQYPKVAARLGLDAPEVSDPYVERLLEGFSFLTARVQLKMDAEYPAFAHRILSLAHPAFLQPQPAAAIVSFKTAHKHSASLGYALSRGKKIRSQAIPSLKAFCPFSLTRQTQLMPLKVADVRFTSVPTDLPLQSLRASQNGKKVQAALRLDLTVNHGTACSALPLEHLDLFLSGGMAVASHLLYLIMNRCVGIVVHDSQDPRRWHYELPNTPEHKGFADDEALSFDLTRSVSGYRLMQEYNALPQKFLFLTIHQIKAALAHAEEVGGLLVEPKQQTKTIMENGVNKDVVAFADRHFSVTFLFDESVPELEGVVSERDVALHCAPVINLFEQRGIRFAVDEHAREQHVVVDKTQPLNYEINRIDEVVGYTKDNKKLIEFKPIYLPPDLGVSPNPSARYAYFAERREVRPYSIRSKEQGGRTSYRGSEVYLSLTDQDRLSWSPQLEHLSVKAWCSSRDLALLMPLDQESDFMVEGDMPVHSIKLASRMTRPKEGITDETSLWHLVNHLGMNYLSLADLAPEDAGRALRQLLSVYLIRGADGLSKQVEAISRVTLTPKTQIVRRQGLTSSIRGVAISVVLDDGLLSGTHPYLFGSVLNHFFARLVSLNSFTQLTISTLQNGEVASWPMMSGERPTL